MATTKSPPASPDSPPTQATTSTPPLFLDLSEIPPLIEPSPPSNTLLITNLNDPAIFHPSSLLEIRTLIDNVEPLHSFSPLKSFRRIVVSFHTTDSAITIRQLLDGTPIMGARARVYFGGDTPIDPGDQHLAAPKSQKLFFISPPPSPPHGWMMRNEEPPNKEVHADDLAAALQKLHAKTGPRGDLEEDKKKTGGKEGEKVANRERSGSSTVVYHPEDHGDNPLLPAVMVEDTTEEDEGVEDDREGGEVKILAHTARPPVELMHDT